ncbi:DNA alkylation repair protein [Undibacterium cyanobacteriorum]|uniref:DNA alkylation repair protein n=1 Tax=Undibacterium cyanobacteriorum TaxID=3073561 RepID=A0ABY9RHZ8_9BURK|nr:DNA alkylation repair protein [Undibacterium sp. 20NA77.5]WMW80838.1 DNA alkylation repair protein [Undibacterium sp. 20NA77.5]
MKKFLAHAMHITDYFEQLQQVFIRHARPENMAAMEAYMLDQFQFLGIKAPQRRALMKELGAPRWSAEQVLELAQALWTLPYREYHYVAVDQLARHVKILQPQHVGTLLELAQSQSWWDSVDGLAGVIGDILLLDQKQHGPRDTSMDAALEHPCMWLRRIAMTHQLGWRLETNTERLQTYALRLADEKEFFIRKAIGWALRDYGRWNKEFVVQFCRHNDKLLSPLSLREALKHLA